MSHFAIAGIQMHIGMRPNIDEMRRRLDILMMETPKRPTCGTSNTQNSSPGVTPCS